VICVPGNVVGSDRYQHIRLAPNPMLAGIIETIQRNFTSFAEWLMPDHQVA
jgi:hypothetical protein